MTLELCISTTCKVENVYILKSQMFFLYAYSRNCKYSIMYLKCNPMRFLQQTFIALTFHYIFIYMYISNNVKLTCFLLDVWSSVSEEVGVELERLRCTSLSPKNICTKKQQTKAKLKLQKAARLNYPSCVTKTFTLWFAAF